MLLVLDIGNTNIKLGVFNGNRLAASWRMSTDRTRTSDEYGQMLMTLMEHENLSPKDMDGVIFSSVVPAINFTIEHMLTYYLEKKPMIVGPGIKTGLNIRLDDPRELGADMICDAVSAYRRYGGPCIVMDFGTATTIMAVTEKGEFLGGAICPGVKVALDALTQRAAKLPNIELEFPNRAIGRNTVNCMQAGLLYGYVGQVEYLIANFKREMECPEAKVIVTGGMSREIAKMAPSIQIVDSLLTLEGLRLIYNNNI